MELENEWLGSNENKGIYRRVGERGSLIRITPKPEFPTEVRIVHPRRDMLTGLRTAGVSPDKRSDRRSQSCRVSLRCWDADMGMDASVLLRSQLAYQTQAEFPRNRSRDGAGE